MESAKGKALKRDLNQQQGRSHINMNSATNIGSTYVTSALRQVCG